MLSRFLQLFLLCSLILLVPSLIYLSNSSSPPIFDSGHLYAPGSILKNGQAAGNESPQLNQGDGYPSKDKLDSSNVPNDWKWPDSLMNPFHKAEDYWKNFNHKVDKDKDKEEDWAQEKKLAEQKLVEAAKGGSSAMVNDSKDGVIMSKMKNETAKAELGRATWKFLHTMTLRYPENPTPSDRVALSNFMHLFSRLYPCGECASHFQALLKEMPPQTSSRNAAAGWLCAAHNRVNDRLKKPRFPCAKLDENYDCGCGKEESVADSMGPQNILEIPSTIQTSLKSEATPTSTPITSMPASETPQTLADLTANNWVPPPLPVLSKRGDPRLFIDYITQFQKREESCQCRASI